MGRIDPKDMTPADIMSCPIYKTMEIFRGKWNTWVLFELGRNDSIRFGELRRAIPGISATVLSSTLDRLIADGLVKRTQYEEIPPRVEYSATQAARDLDPIFDAMWRWGEEHAG